MNEQLITRIAKLLAAFVGILLVILGMAALTSGWTHDLLLKILAINPQSPEYAIGGEKYFVLQNLQIFGRDMLFRGVILLVALIWLLLSQKDSIQAWLQKPANTTRMYALVGVFMLLLVVLWVPVILVGYSTTIGDTRYWWLFDDAMISMRYAYNLAHGYGLVWNPGGAHVEGYTNFLWVLYMAIIHLFPIPITTTSLIVALTNIVLSLACIPILIKIIRLLEGGTFAVVATLVTYIFSLNIMGWATAGAETVLLSFLFLLSLARVLQDIQQQQVSLTTCLIIGIMTLVRSDAILLAAMLYGILFLLQRDKKRVVLYAAVSFLLPAAHIGFRLWYYGDIVPNTAHLKVTNWDNKFNHGIAYVTDFISSYLLLVLFAFIGAITIRKNSQRLLFAGLLCYTGYVAYAGGDAFLQFRFFVPILPLIMVLAYVALERVVRWASFRVVVAAMCLISIPLHTPGDTTPLYSRHMATGNIEIALLLKENLAPTTTVADFWAGIVFYYSHVQGIDLLGKNDPHIAKMPALYGDIPGHNKFDFDYSLGVLKPDLVNAPFALPPDEEELEEWRESEAPWRGELYFNQTFREHCYPYPIEVSTWRTLFACDWSPEASRRSEWETPY